MAGTDALSENDMKAIILILMFCLAGCSYIPVNTNEHKPVYKYNYFEGKYELTHPASKLHYNVMEREWVYVK